MIRRLTIACGLLTLAVVLAVQGPALLGARHVHRGATSVTVIKDKPSSWPPVKPVPPAPPQRAMPPAPQPQPMQHAPAVQTQPAPHSAASGSSPVQQIIGIAHTLFNLPKAIGDDETQVAPGR